MSTSGSPVTTGQRFTFIGGSKAFEKLKKSASINESKILDQSRLSFPIVQLFEQSCLYFLLTLAYPFNSEMLYKFYANLHVESDFSKISSRVFYVDVEFTKDDLCQYLNVTKTGPSAHVDSHRTNWTEINRVLRGRSLPIHSPAVSEFLTNPRVIQHVLRHSILAKAGDLTKITPVMSLATYFISTGTTFDVADLLIRYIENISQVREATTARKINVALGHVIGYLVEQKYDLVSPIAPDVHPVYFSDRSFTPFYGSKRRKGKQVEEDSEEEEEAPPESSQPIQEEHDDRSLFARVEHLQHSLDEHIHYSRERFDWQEQSLRRQEDSMKRQEDNLAWIKARFDRAPPPDEGDFF